MRKLKLLSVLFALGVSFASAQTLPNSHFQDNPDLGGDATIVSATERYSTNRNSIDFEVESTSNGMFYANFWLMPIRYSNNTYSTYQVYVNEKLAGTINPTFGNWQNISLSGNKKISLNSGRNIISVVSTSSEIPSVEFVKLGKSKERANIISEYYENFYDRAIANSEKNKEASKKSKSSRGIQSISIMNPLDTVSQNITTFSAPTYVKTTAYVDYTFYKEFNWVAGQTYTFRLDGWQPFYLEIYSKNQGAFASTASSKLNTSNQSWSITHSITAPYTGQFFVRVRGNKQTTASVCDMVINNAQYFDNIPLYTFGYICSQGGSGDNNYYSAFTRGARTVDPVLYVQNSSGQILCWNDDNNNTYATKYYLQKNDAFVRSKYSSQAAYAVYVTSYASYSSPGSCDLYIRVKDTDDLGITSTTRSLLYSAAGSGTTNNSDILQTKETSVYPNPASVSSVININSDDDISQISIYDLSGRLISTKKINSNSVSLSTSSLGINATGMYFMQIHSNKGAESKKLIIN